LRSQGVLLFYMSFHQCLCLYYIGLMLRDRVRTLS